MFSVLKQYSSFLYSCSLRFFLLPALLGDLTLSVTSTSRLDTIQKARVYFVDYLQRSKSYAVTSEVRDDHHFLSALLQFCSQLSLSFHVELISHSDSTLCSPCCSSVLHSPLPIPPLSPHILFLFPSCIISFLSTSVPIIALFVFRSFSTPFLFTIDTISLLAPPSPVLSLSALRCRGSGQVAEWVKGGALGCPGVARNSEAVIFMLVWFRISHSPLWI